ncbi:hypothetical protein [Ramlibacter sp.]|uniref:hypothetical protein n=1 Tax=Ramlibacter sp. TaxID=1917967 RepID=UPI003D0E6980
MTDVTTNALRGIVKTLDDVVLPAIPADDPLAIQELKMVSRYLAFSRQRVEHLYARARYELEFYAGVASECAEALGKAAPQLADLEAGVAAARDLLAKPGAAIGALRVQTQRLMTRLSRLLLEVEDADALARVERIVVRRSAEITAFDRSWYLPLKLERFPGDVRPLASFIAIHES